MTRLNEFYGFQRTPFTKSVAAQDLYPSRGHREAQGRLAFALQDRSAALLTGDVGTGKSTAARAFAQALDLYGDVVEADAALNRLNPDLNDDILAAHDIDTFGQVEGDPDLNVFTGCIQVDRCCLNKAGDCLNQVRVG